MRIPRLFRPLPDLDDEERRRGLGHMTRQAVAASGADGLASGGLLAAFALILGASNFQIGVMTAIPFVMQPLQLAAVVAVERLRLRKAVAVAASFFTYATWIPVALLPFLIDVPNPRRGDPHAAVHRPSRGGQRLREHELERLAPRLRAAGADGGVSSPGACGWRPSPRRCRPSPRPSTSTGGRPRPRAARSSPTPTPCSSAASSWDSPRSASWRACRSRGWSSPKARAPRSSAAWGRRCGTATSGS